MSETTAAPSGYGVAGAEGGPVTDWATDFDHADPGYNKHAHAIWDGLRETCPVAHSDRYGGAWLPTRHDDVREIAYDTDHFTSRQVIVHNADKSPDGSGVGPSPPISSDPPHHKAYRKLLLAPFRPDQIAPYEDEIRAICRARLDALGEIAPGQSVVDAAAQYAQYIPPAVIARMLGLPPEDDDLFREHIGDLLEGVGDDAEERHDSGRRLDDYLMAAIDDHIDNPRDDLISALLDAEIDGEPLGRLRVLGAIRLLLIAGIDTTWSAIGSSLWHLAQHPDDRRRLREEPELMPIALEEFLRAYAPVTMARLVRDDYDFHGCPMKKGDWVLLPFPAANRDPEIFERADEFVIDREINRHSAFGLGIHRCLGSNLARLELRVAIEEFIARFPDFELADPDAVTWSRGQIRGPRQLPVRIR